jgi:hypothetical protein
MLGLFLDCYTIRVQRWARLPVFQRYLPKQGTNSYPICAIFTHCFLTQYPSSGLLLSYPCRNLPQPMVISLPQYTMLTHNIKVKQLYTWRGSGWVTTQKWQSLKRSLMHSGALKTVFCTTFLAHCPYWPGPSTNSPSASFPSFPNLLKTRPFIHRNPPTYTMRPWRWMKHVPSKHEEHHPQLKIVTIQEQTHNQ